MMRFSWDSLGLLIALLQFPLYAVIITVVKGMRWKVVALVLVVVIHVLTASIALRDYCQSRRTCELVPVEDRLPRG